MSVVSLPQVPPAYAIKQAENLETLAEVLMSYMSSVASAIGARTGSLLAPYASETGIVVVMGQNPAKSVTQLYLTISLIQTSQTSTIPFSSGSLVLFLSGGASNGTNFYPIGFSSGTVSLEVSVLSGILNIAISSNLLGYTLGVLIQYV